MVRNGPYKSRPLLLCSVLRYRTEEPDSTACVVKSEGPPTMSEKESCDNAVEYLLDPVTGSPVNGSKIAGVINIHVDDIFATGGEELERRVL